MTSSTTMDRRSPVTSIALFCAMTLCLWLVFVWWNWGAIGRVNLEAGDFAANSLQVLQAKSGILLDGHYSRFGFLHPGPALLYLLTGFEVLFVDGLGVLTSPFSGHLAAAAFLAAACVSAVAFSVRGLSSRWLVAAPSAASVIAVVAWQDTQVITSPWMPYMVVLPFTALMTTSALAATGDARALPGVAVFTGVLVHGHASFFFITFVIVVAALAYNVLAQRKGSSGRILSVAYWRRHPWALSSAVAIGVCFLLPVAIRTIRDWPGPIYDYLTVGDSAAGRGLSGSVEALASHPRGSWVVVVTVAALVVLVTLTRRRLLTTGGGALLVMLVVATAAHILYVVGSVDDPANTHLLLYFLAIPALLPTAALVVLAQDVRRPSLWITITAVTVAAAMIALVAFRPQVWPRDYLRSEITAVDLQIPVSTSPTVIDLEDTGNWGNIWSGALGWLLLRERTNPNARVCIRENWFIGFTEKFRCTPTDIETGNAYRISDSGGGLIVQYAGS